jgi:hypothetical protein
MGANLITKAEYKAHVGITSTTDDAIIDSLIPKVSELVKSYCKQSFVDNIDEPLVEIFDGGVEFSLSQFPLVGSPLVELSVDYGKTFTTLTEYTDYVVLTKSGYIKSTSALGFTDYLNGYRVTYAAGYETLPLDLKMAVLDLVTFYRRNDSAIHSPKAPGTNTVQIEYSNKASFPGSISLVLDAYIANAL